MTTSPKKQAWQQPPVHPAAEMLPMMSSGEIEELARDIEANGLQQPIILFRDNTEEANGRSGPFPLYLLDGRNRLAALKRLGIVDPRQAKSGQIVDSQVRVLNAVQEGFTLSGGRTSRTTWTSAVNPTTFVLSANVRRRHLTTAQKRAAIAAYIEADPKASNRKVARELGVTDPTVAKVRQKIPDAKNLQSEPSPRERVTCILRENPTLTANAAAKIAGVGMSTAYAARKQLVADGVISDQPVPQPRRKPTPKAPPGDNAMDATEKAAARNAERCANTVNEIATLVTELDRAVTTLGSYILTESQTVIVKTQADLMRDIAASLRALGDNK